MKLLIPAIVALLLTTPAYAQKQSATGVYLWHTTYGCPAQTAVEQLHVAFGNGLPMDEIAARNGCVKLLQGQLGQIFRADGPFAEVRFFGPGTLWVMGDLLAPVPNAVMQELRKPNNAKSSHPCCPSGVHERDLGNGIVEECDQEEC